MSEKKDEIEIDDLGKTELIIEIKPVKRPVVKEVQVDIIDIDKEIEEIQQKLNEITKFIDENEERIWFVLNNIFCDRRHIKAKKNSDEYIDVVYCIDMPVIDKKNIRKIIERLFELAYKYRKVAETAYAMIEELEKCERYFEEPNMVIFDDPVRMISYYPQYLASENIYIHYIDLFYIFDIENIIRIKLHSKGDIERAKMVEVCYQDRKIEKIYDRLIDFLSKYTYVPCLSSELCI